MTSRFRAAPLVSPAMTNPGNESGQEYPSYWMKTSPSARSGYFQDANADPFFAFVS
jgi:hypothetical protein